MLKICFSRFLQDCTIQYCTCICKIVCGSEFEGLDVRYMPPVRLVNKLDEEGVLIQRGLGTYLPWGEVPGRREAPEIDTEGSHQPYFIIKSFCICHNILYRNAVHSTIQHIVGPSTSSFHIVKVIYVQLQHIPHFLQ